ncbi:hypothetical protein QM012_007482 [Aureobasidium pullulans]|uniref:Uncharacterized protein n=1 Tax=Aureobasidium pullulans TaxID=5580 RepID=A0ABR0TPQ5_AURPU
MPASLTLHTTNSQTSLTSDMARSTLRPAKHVRFAPELQIENSDYPTLDSSDSYKDWSPTTSASPAIPHVPEGARNSSEDRQTMTRHTIPHGSSRRESVEDFDDVRRRWSMESLSEESSAIDDE